MASISANDDVRSCREFALLQAFINGLVKNVRNLALGWGEDDFTGQLCAFCIETATRLHTKLSPYVNHPD